MIKQTLLASAALALASVSATASAATTSSLFPRAAGLVLSSGFTQLVLAGGFKNGLPVLPKIVEKTLDAKATAAFAAPLLDGRESRLVGLLLATSKAK